MRCRCSVSFAGAATDERHAASLPLFPRVTPPSLCLGAAPLCPFASDTLLRVLVAARCRAYRPSPKAYMTATCASCSMLSSTTLGQWQQLLSSRPADHSTIPSTSRCLGVYRVTATTTTRATLFPQSATTAARQATIRPNASRAKSRSLAGSTPTQSSITPTQRCACACAYRRVHYARLRLCRMRGSMRRVGLQVAGKLNSWIQWMVRTYDIDAIRLDTTAYISKRYLHSFKAAAGLPVYGEITSGNLTYLRAYLDDDPEARAPCLCRLVPEPSLPPSSARLARHPPPARIVHATSRRWGAGPSWTLSPTSHSSAQLARYQASEAALLASCAPSLPTLTAGCPSAAALHVGRPSAAMSRSLRRPHRPT